MTSEQLAASIAACPRPQPRSARSPNGHFLRHRWSGLDPLYCATVIYLWNHYSLGRPS